METVPPSVYRDKAEKSEEDDEIKQHKVFSSKRDVGSEEETNAELHIPLPLHLSMRILALLSFSCIARMRLVCKAWNSLISSSSFQQNFQQECKLAKKRTGSEGGEWWFVMAAEAGSKTPFSHDFIAFSYPTWRSFRLPNIHSSAKLGHLLLRMAFSQSLVPSVVNMLVASDGGLICAVVKGGSQLMEQACSRKNTTLISELNYDVVVFNCLTGELKRLPRPERLANRLISSCLITMREEEGSGLYRIILSDFKYRDMEIYEAQSGRWRVGQGISRSRADDDQNNIISSFTDLLQADVMRYHKDELATYQIKLDTWTKTELDLPRVQAGTELLRSTVVRCAGGAILLVACLMRHSVCMEGFGVWRLVEDGGRRGGAARFEWAEVARTPLEVLAAFERTTFDSPAFYDCRFVGGRYSEWICMTGVHYTIGCQKSRAEYWPPLLYNVQLNEWRLLPSHAAHHSHNFLCIFPFQPRFHTPL